MAEAIKYKTCGRCKHFLPIAEFQKHKICSGHRFDGVCKDCQAIARHGSKRKQKLYAVREGVKFRVCSRCRIEMVATLMHFSPNPSGMFGLRSLCRKCDSIRSTESRKRRDPTGKSYRVRMKSWNERNRAKVHLNHKRYRDKRKADPEKQSRFRIHARNFMKQQRRIPKYRLIKNIRERMRLLLKDESSSRGLLRRLHYSRADLIMHIERQFQKGMTWKNYGRNGWHLDHVLPVSMFDPSNEEQFRACWALPNLRPAWERDNIAKGARREFLL